MGNMHDNRAMFCFILETGEGYPGSDAMENAHNFDLFDDSLINTNWFFAPDVLEAFEKIGMSGVKALRSFMLMAQSSRIIPEGEERASILGLGLKIKRRGCDIFVDLLDEGQVNRSSIDRSVNGKL